MKERFAVVFGGITYSVDQLDRHIEDRVEKAVELYRNGRISKIILSGAGCSKDMYGFCLRGGIPSNALIMENDSLSTLENLSFPKRILFKSQMEMALDFNSFLNTIKFNKAFPT